MERKYQIGDVLRVVAGSAHSGEIDGDDEYHYYITDTVVHVVDVVDDRYDGGYMICAPLPTRPSVWVDGDDHGTQFLRERDVQLVHRMQFKTITDVEDYLNNSNSRMSVVHDRLTTQSPDTGSGTVR